MNMILRKIGLLFIVLTSIIFTNNSIAQDLAHGDNLSFAYGTAGWKGTAGDYNGDASTGPVWSQSAAYNDITSAKDDCNQNLFTIISTNGTDPHTNNALSKIPTHLGFTKSMRINNDISGCTSGYSCNGLPSYAEAKYDLTVDEDNCLVSVYYAIVLEAPHPGSGYYNPTFQIDVISGGSLVSECAFWETTGDPNIPSSLFVNGASGWIYCPWQQVKMNLANYIGESVTIRIRVGDCKADCHAGYGYIVAKAEKPTIQVAGCAGEGNIITTATAPQGFEAYKWFRVTRNATSQSQLEALEPADNSADVLSTDSILTVTEAMMQGQTTQYFAVKLISPRTQNTRPNCVAYIKATVNDIRPNFDAITYIPVDPLNERDEVGFKFSDIVQRTEDSPLIWQAIAFGDGDSVAFDKDATTNIWAVSNATPLGENTRVTIDNANQSIDVVYHNYQPGEHIATRYATSDYSYEDEEGNTIHIYCERKDTIKFTVFERPSIKLEATDTICMRASDTIFASSPDNAEELVENYQYYWWRNIEDTASAPIYVGTEFIMNNVVSDTSVVVKVVDEVNGFFRFGYFTIYVQEFPDISLSGDTMLCMGQTAHIEASDATGNTKAMQWSFNDPGENPHITNPSTNPVLSFTPSQDTVVWLICETSAGCIASKSVHIIMTNPKVSSDKSKICPLDEVTLTGSNAVDYSWTANPPDASLTEDVRSEEPVVVTPKETTTYTMRGYGSSGCYTERQITINVVPVPIPLISYSPAYVDAEDPILSLSDASLYGTYSLWRFSDGGTSNDRVLRYQFHDLSVDSVSIYLKTANEVGQHELFTNQYNCSADTSITLPIELFAVWVPNAFSPNGDGVNDRFFFLSDNQLEDVSFEVFNRWGTKIFSFSEKALNLSVLTQDVANSIGWDGTYKGKTVKDGVYVWKLQYKRQGNTRVYQRTGTVNVVK